MKTKSKSNNNSSIIKQSSLDDLLKNFHLTSKDICFFSTVKGGYLQSIVIQKHFPNDIVITADGKPVKEGTYHLNQPEKKEKSIYA